MYMSQKADISLLLAMSLSVAISTLNIYHLYPGFDLFHNLISIVITLIGICLFLIYRKRKLIIHKSVITWFLLFMLLLIQPLINNITYPDSLIFPLGSLLVIIILTICLSSVKNKELFFNGFHYSLIGVLILSSSIQFLQLRGISLSISGHPITIVDNRIAANFLQPNQAAFMFVLGLLSCLYFNEKKFNYGWLFIFSLFSLSIALTLSRTGLVMAICSTIFFYLLSNNIRYRLIKSASYLLLTGLSYTLGLLFFRELSIGTGSNIGLGAITRFSEGSLYMRESLAYQSWLMFIDHPIRGYGWGNFVQGGIDNFEKLRWFTFSQHSHLFVTQIASELGVIGLFAILPMAWYLFKKLSFNNNLMQTMCYSSILIILLYSSSEFPLWYFRYLSIFPLYLVFLSKDSIFYLDEKFNKFLLTLCLLFSIGSIFYINNFIEIHLSYKKIQNENLTDKELIQIYNELPKVYGFSQFNEHVLFYFIPIDDNNLQEKISIGERTIGTALNKVSLFKYAQLLAMNNQSVDSLYMFKATCALDWDGGCKEVAEKINDITQANPKKFSEINSKFNEWVVDFDPLKN